MGVKLLRLANEFSTALPKAEAAGWSPADGEGSYSVVGVRDWRLPKDIQRNRDGTKEIILLAKNL